MLTLYQQILRLLLLLIITFIYSSCDKKLEEDRPVDNNRHDAPDYYQLQAEEFAFRHNTHFPTCYADHSRDTIIFSCEDYVLMDDSTAYRESRVLPFASDAANFIYIIRDLQTNRPFNVFKLQPSNVNPYFVVIVNTYKPFYDSTGLYYEQAPTRFVFDARTLLL